jgi:hypothetical protein
VLVKSQIIFSFEQEGDFDNNKKGPWNWLDHPGLGGWA